MEGQNVTDETLLTTTKIAARSGMSVAWFILHRKKGTGPPFHQIGGGAIRYHWADWEAYLAANRFDSRAADGNSAP